MVKNLDHKINLRIRLIQWVLKMAPDLTMPYGLKIGLIFSQKIFWKINNFY